jgi:hypothetical protein
MMGSKSRFGRFRVRTSGSAPHVGGAGSAARNMHWRRVLADQSPRRDAYGEIALRLVAQCGPIDGWGRKAGEATTIPSTNLG